MKPFFVQVEINSNLFVKDPLKTSLGRKIIEHSVLLIDEIGLEQFNFKKLAKEIGSVEVSIYRYFKNKHHLFVYLLNWYWEWMTARINLNTLNISAPRHRLKVALGVIIDTANRNMNIEFVDEEILHKIVVREGAKAYHHKLVDEDNQDGFFLAYKRMCNDIANIIIDIKPDFKYPRALASLLIETANNNLYFARHLLRLTDLEGSNDDQVLNNQVKEMLEFFAFGLIDQNNTVPQMAKMAKMNNRQQSM